MTKTTSYEISKELEEIGFEAKYSFVRHAEVPCESDNLALYCDNYRPPRKSAEVPSYDLETILDALPYSIKHKGFEYFLSLNQYTVVYENHEPETDADLYGKIRNIESGESLADTAARLLIKLAKDKIINLNK